MIDLSELNDSQRDAVRHIDGPEIIIAGAGSGKTKTLVYRLAYLLDSGVDPGRIVAVTFTNKAAKEMKDRATKLVGKKATKVWISTYHSMCLAILRETCGLVGFTDTFTISDEDDRKKRILEVCKQYLKEQYELLLQTHEQDRKRRPIWIDDDKRADTLASELSLFASNCKNRGWTPDEARANLTQFGVLEPEQEQFLQLYEAYQQKNRTDNVMDFDDLLLYTYVMLRDTPYILDIYRTKVEHLMVDEFQDTNGVQMKIVQLLASGHMNLCVVGDDDQSIYAFRGAEVENILKFTDRYPGAYVSRLGENYRSTQTIVNAASAVVSNNEDRLEKVLVSQNDIGEKINVIQANNMLAEATAVSTMIENLISNGAHPKDIAVLYRANAISRNIEEGLIRSKIPYQIVGGLSFYDRKEIKDLVSYLRVICNPADSVALKRIINVPKRGIGDVTVESFANEANAKGISMFEALQKADKKGRSYAAVAKFVQIIKGLQAFSDGHTINELLAYLVDQLKYKEYLLTLKEDPNTTMSRDQNIDEFIDAAAVFEETEHPMGRGPERVRSFLDHIALYTENRKGKGDDCVTLMTMHASKGLEFPYVFLVALEDGLFPRNSDEHELQEERRLMYVAMTRAKRYLTLSFAEERMRRGVWQKCSPSRFIDEIPEEYIARYSFVRERPYSGRSSSSSWWN